MNELSEDWTNLFNAVAFLAALIGLGMLFFWIILRSRGKGTELPLLLSTTLFGISAVCALAPTGGAQTVWNAIF